MKTREEQLQFAKDRAMQYIAVDDWVNAWSSMVSDLMVHPELANHPGIQLGTQLIMTENLKTTEGMKKFIEGFN